MSPRYEAIRERGILPGSCSIRFGSPGETAGFKAVADECNPRTRQLGRLEAAHGWLEDP